MLLHTRPRHQHYTAMGERRPDEAVREGGDGGRGAEYRVVSVRVREDNMGGQGSQQFK
jgi:hypothetical protein